MSMDYLDSKKSFEVLLKMDYHDFVTDYWNSINDDHVFDPSGKIDTAIVLVNQYLAERVQIYADEKKLKGEITGVESANGEVKLNLVYNIAKGAKNIRVKNLVLTSVYKDQSNLLIFKYNDYEEGVRLTTEKLEHSFSIK